VSCKLATCLRSNRPGFKLTDSVQRAEAEILRYLLAHQTARDTVEGVEKWWLPRSRRFNRADIEAALRDLEKRELLRVWQSASALPIYGQGTADLRITEAYLLSIE
jgi:hypothetical protein